MFGRTGGGSHEVDPHFGTERERTLSGTEADDLEDSSVLNKMSNTEAPGHFEMRKCPALT